MNSIVRLSQLTDLECAELPADTIALIPLGSLEPHGSLPLGTDGFISERILELVAGAVPDTCLLPSIPLGYLFKYSGRAGSLGVRASVVEGYVADLCVGLAAAGMKRVFVMSGHDENREPALLGLHEAHRRAGAIAVYCDWLDLAVALARELSTSQREGHGSEVQAAVLRHLRPDLRLDLSRSERTHSPSQIALGADDLFAPSEAGTWVRPAASSSSFTGDPAAGTSTLGARVVERIVARSAEILQALRTTPLRS